MQLSFLCQVGCNFALRIKGANPYSLRCKTSMPRINLDDSNSKLNVSRERKSAMEFIGGRHAEFYRRGKYIFFARRGLSTSSGDYVGMSLILISTQRLAEIIGKEIFFVFFSNFIFALVCFHLVALSY